MKEVRARVILQEKGLYTLSYEGKENKAEVSGKFRYQVNQLSEYPAVGDYVIASWPEDGSPSIISNVFPRKSVFIRKAAGSGNKEQVVAANIDTIFLCMSLNNDFNLRRLERYLSISLDSGATPVIVLTKADLIEDIEAKVYEVTEIACGMDVVTISSVNDDYDAVKKYLKKGTTIAFMGSSGVGKSTLINKLLGEEALKTAAIRADDHKGKHTTTHRELITLENGACVIDTPGMRELGLWNNEEGMESAFFDIEDLMAGCKYSNCSHGREPGCRIQAALKDGTLSKDRWNSYKKLLKENDYSASGSEYMKSKKAKFKEISKINKSRRR